MIRKSLLLMGMFSFVTYANSVVTLHKDNGECKIIKKNKTKKDCSKKGSYLLEVDDTVKSSKVSREDFSYNQTKSALKPVFVVPIDEGYKIEKSFLTYLSSAYNNFMNPNKSNNEGGTYGSAKNKDELPTKSKIFYDKNLTFKLNFQFTKCELKEQDSGDKINQGLSLKKESSQITIKSKNLDKDKIYNLYIYHGVASRHTINISFLQDRQEQVYREFLQLEEKEQLKYGQAILKELGLNLNFYNKGKDNEKNNFTTKFSLITNKCK